MCDVIMLYFCQKRPESSCWMLALWGWGGGILLFAWFSGKLWYSIQIPRLKHGQSQPYFCKNILFIIILSAGFHWDWERIGTYFFDSEKSEVYDIAQILANLLAVYAEACCLLFLAANSACSGSCLHKRIYLGLAAHGPSLSGWGRSHSSGYGGKSYYEGAKYVLEDTMHEYKNCVWVWAHNCQP